MGKTTTKTTTKVVKKDSPAVKVAGVLEERLAGRKNFTTKEDVLLTRAYVTCTLDPMKGCDQTADLFWGKVFETFQTLVHSELEVIPVEERNSASLRSRFQKRIQKESKKWIAIQKNTPKASGDSSDESHMKIVSEKYWEKYGKPFPFEGCLEYLFKLPKFDPAVSKGGSKTDCSYENVGTGLPRPVGSKKAKNLIKNNI